jgi:hypothetical protein
LIQVRKLNFFVAPKNFFSRSRSELPSSSVKPYKTCKGSKRELKFSRIAVQNDDSKRVRVCRCFLTEFHAATEVHRREATAAITATPLAAKDLNTACRQRFSVGFLHRSVHEYVCSTILAINSRQWQKSLLLQKRKRATLSSSPTALNMVGLPISPSYLRLAFLIISRLNSLVHNIFLQKGNMKKLRGRRRAASNACGR